MSDVLCLNDFYCLDFHVQLVKGFHACVYPISGLILINLCEFILLANSAYSSVPLHSLCDALLLVCQLAPHDVFCHLIHQAYPNFIVSSFTDGAINAAKQDGPSYAKVCYLSLVSLVVIFSDWAAQIESNAYLVHLFPEVGLSKLAHEKHPISKIREADQI